MLIIRQQQMTALAEDCAKRRIKFMANSILTTFQNELTNHNPAAIHRQVAHLVGAMRAHNFHNYAIVYRLVCWGIFLGEDYLNQPPLAAIAHSSAPETERFNRILHAITQ